MKINENFVAIVTGGASGLGRGAVIRFTSLGAKVVIADINEEKGKEVAAQTKAIFKKTDISVEAEVKQLFEFTKKTFGQVHAVVNSAGTPSIGPIISSRGVSSTQELERVLKTNVVGCFNVAKYAALFMSQQPEVNGDRGCIILVTSPAGVEGQKGQTAYGASKGAVNGMVLPITRELGKLKIRVMAISPGVFITPMTDLVPKKAMDVLKAHSPLARFGVPAEFAHLAQSIIENPFINGGIWRIDGGMRMPNL